MTERGHEPKYSRNGNITATKGANHNPRRNTKDDRLVHSLTVQP